MLGLIVNTMFGLVERLEKGKKVSGKIHFPLFGTTAKKEGKKVLDGTHMNLLSPLNWTESTS
jgi:hypothetical protein